MLIATLSLLLIAKASAQSFDFYEANLKAGETAPTIVFVHGGAWVSRSKANYKPLGEALAKQGYCVAVVDYELAPKAVHPTQVEQVDVALKNIEKKKSGSCRTNQLFLVGHSAGAHIISFWNSRYSDANVKGFVGLEGIYDIPKLVKRWPDYKAEFIQTEFGAENKWASASPALLKMKSASPWLVIQSDQDELVDMAQSKDFVDHLRSGAGTKPFAELVVVKGLSHFGAVDSLADAKSEASAALKAFVAKAKK